MGAQERKTVELTVRQMEMTRDVLLRDAECLSDCEERGNLDKEGRADLKVMRNVIKKLNDVLIGE